MIKKFLPISILVFIFFAISVETIAKQYPDLPSKIDYTKSLDSKFLKGKSLSNLWIMRNEIFARHGRPFRTYELHCYFMSTGWYKPDEQFSIKKLSPIEIKNVQLILNEEKKLLAKNYYDKNGTMYINFNNVLNDFQFNKFTQEEIKKLSQNGFIVLPTKKNQLFHIYENNDYLGIPSFITTDSVLQLYHLFFDMTLRNLEQNYLSKSLEVLCKELLEHMKEIYLKERDENIKTAAFHNMVYFSIPYYFISDGKIDLPPEAKQLALKEINLCKEHPPWIDSPLLKRKFDYSQFIPRGHYTRNDILKKYFMSMMWLGLAGIDIKGETSIPLIQGILVTHHLYTKNAGKQPLIELWRDIYDPTVFYVGLSDDLGPEDFKESMDQVFGINPNLSDFSDGDKLIQIQKILLNKFKNKTKITGHGMWGTQGAQFRVMGQRFIPDSYIFHRLTIIDRDHNYYRYFPNGLDVMAVFGSKTAEELMLGELKYTWDKWPNYPKELKKLIFDYSNLDEKQWRQNLYYNWLWCLKSLIVLREKNKYPFFMKTEGWKRKSLSTALGSWAELRHDTILYAKQSIAAEGGGDEKKVKVWIPEPPKGYVEPNLEFYQRLLTLLRYTRDSLSLRNMIDNRMKSLFNRFLELAEFMEDISMKELENRPITLQEYKQIQKMGSLLDNLTLTVLLEGDPYATWGLVEGPDKNMPVIADVHTADFEALEVGVGKAHEIYVIVEIDGKLKLTRGAVFSYYEFLWPANDRLTDEKWQEMLNEDNVPPLPAWTNYYRSIENKQKDLKPLYLPPVRRIPAWSTEPGWKTIYYLL